MQYLSFSDFLHLEGPSDLPTVLLQMTLFQTFFLWQSNLTLSVYECIKIVYPFICGCTSWLLLCLHPLSYFKQVSKKDLIFLAYTKIKNYFCSHLLTYFCRLTLL